MVPGTAAGYTLAMSGNVVPDRAQMAATLGFHIILACLGIALPVNRAAGRVHRAAAARRDGDAAGAALVAGDGRAGRGRRGDRHGAVVRDGAAVAGADAPVRGGARASRSASRGCSSSWRPSSPGSTCGAGGGCRGWAHWWSGVPIALSGIFGAMSVIAVNAWMNQPGGFTEARRPDHLGQPVAGVLQPRRQPMRCRT